MTGSMGKIFPFSWLRLCLALTVATVVAAGFQQPAFAQEDTSEQERKAVEFITGIANQAFELQSDQALSDDDRFNQLRDIMAKGLAIEFIGKLMLGSFYDSASEAQLEEYNAVFPEYITRFYAEQLGNIAKAEIEFQRSIAARRDIIVRTQIKRANGDPITVDWRVREFEGEGQKIIDIIVSGASLMFVKRDEFRALIRQKGFDALIAELRRQASMPRVAESESQ